MYVKIMKPITIIANMEIKKNKKYMQEIKEYLNDKNIECLFANVQQDNFGNYIYDIEQSSYIITLGGDGTVLQAAQNALETRTPIIPFNTGTLGFLAEYKIKDFKFVLDKVLNKEYFIDSRMMLEVYKDGELLDTCLNDIVISREGFSRIVSIESIVGNNILNKYRGDGIIISTPTGSTGYNLSLGGPILSPKSKNILITPIACHSLLSRSIVLDESEIVNIKILKSRKTQDKEAILTCDGRKNIDLHSGDELVVKKCKKNVNLIKLDNNFFDICNKKLR